MNYKSVCTAVAVLALVLSSSTDARVIARSATSSISVNGEAEIRVAPDEVMLSLGVESFDRVLKAAKADNDERIKKTIAVARSYGVPAEYIQTDFIQIEPAHRGGDIALELQGYVVRKSVVIRLRDISKFEGLLTDAIDAGVTHVHGVDFRTTELRKYRDQARSLALKAAREKADLLAKDSGHAIEELQSIGEASYGYMSSYGSWWGSRYSSMTQNVVQSFGGASLGSDSALAPGQISIRASVSVNYGLK